MLARTSAFTLARVTAHITEQRTQTPVLPKLRRPDTHGILPSSDLLRSNTTACTRGRHHCTRSTADSSTQVGHGSPRPVQPDFAELLRVAKGANAIHKACAQARRNVTHTDFYTFNCVQVLRRQEQRYVRVHSRL